MTRINCHSAFKHYEMFHSRFGGGNNYGSIFNTTYNIKCGGHGGFWSGVGYGVGNVLGGLFGGLLGGGMNYNGYGIGLPMMNYGLPSWGNFWGGGGGGIRIGDSDNSSKKTKEKDKTESSSECNDPDRQKLVDYGKNVNDLIKNKDTKPADLKALYDKIKQSQTDSKTEKHHKATDPSDYQNWLDILKTEAEKRGWGDLDSDDFGKNVAPKTNENTKPVSENKNEVAPSSSTGNSNNTDSTRTYTNGFTNYDGKTTIKPEEFIKVHDEGSNDDGKPKDIVPKNSTDGVKITQETGKAPSSITVTTSSGTSVTYTITNNGQPNSYGEYVYTSPRGQEYILQKGSDGHYLMQYSFHTGYNIPDTH